jgi:hypothetical protein
MKLNSSSIPRENTPATEFIFSLTEAGKWIAVEEADRGDIIVTAEDVSLVQEASGNLALCVIFTEALNVDEASPEADSSPLRRGFSRDWVLGKTPAEA